MTAGNDRYDAGQITAALEQQGDAACTDPCWHCSGTGRLPHCEHDPLTIPGDNGPAWIECFLCGKRLETFDD